MSARREVRTRAGATFWLLLAMVVCAMCSAKPGEARRRSGESALQVEAGLAPVTVERTEQATGVGAGLAIPAGTILPVRLNATISSGTARAGQVITGKIVQDVPLAGGRKIPAGTKVAGHIVEWVAASVGMPGHLSLQFDKVMTRQGTISVTTSLRAMAGFMQIAEAQVPPSGAGETDVYRWLTTIQIGGDVVYGEDGPVTSGTNPNETIGKKVNGGVLGEVRAREGTKCRGAVGGNDTAQALWVFSTDACGTYGMEHIHIAHAGRSEPVGLIVLASDGGDLKIASGAGLLLRVNPSVSK